MFWLFIGVVLLIGAVGMIAARKFGGVTALATTGGSYAIRGVAVLSIMFLALGTFDKAFFYAEPGYIYHVRTITGTEKTVDSVGYNGYWFGRVNAWKKAMTVQAVPQQAGLDSLESEREGGANTSASLPVLNIMFLDQVDANAAATARFRLPTDTETFLKLAHEYRSPENLLRTALIPAFKETLQSTASLMSAEEYYSGSRTSFNTEFEVQLQSGIYIVKRIERTVVDETDDTNATANASLVTQQRYRPRPTKTIFVVEKQLDAAGIPRRKEQRFIDFGISVVEARITEMVPNDKFRDRMELKQKASADRAIAREQRVQEQEQRLLAIAKGEREVAERQAEAKVEQIAKTTAAETDKQLAITAANKVLESAAIAKKTAQIKLEQARIDAQSIKTLADAEAYKKKAIITADNALQQKLDAYVAVQQAYAKAFAQRKVPTTVFGASEGGPGSDSDLSTFLKIQTMKSAQDLNFDPAIRTVK